AVDNCWLFEPGGKGELCPGAHQRARRSQARADQDTNRPPLPSEERRVRRLTRSKARRLYKIGSEIGWFGAKGHHRSGANDGGTHVIARSHFHLDAAVASRRRLRDRAESHWTYPRPLARTARDRGHCRSRRRDPDRTASFVPALGWTDAQGFSAGTHT